GVQESRVRRALAQLPAKPVQMNVDRLVLADRGLAPYLLQQFTPRNDPARSCGEVGQQVELFAREGQRGAIQVRLPSTRVDPPHADVYHARLGPAGPSGTSQYRRHAGVEVHAAERLDHVVVGAGAQQPYDLGLVVAGGRDDDRGIGDPAEHAQGVRAV